MQTPDGYWRVEVVKYGRRERWFRILHASTVVAEKASIATVQQILGDLYATLQPVDVGGENDGAA